MNTMMRTAVIAYKGKAYKARVVDLVTGLDRPKRVRIMNDPLLEGKVLMPGDYTLKGFVDDED